MEVKKIATFLLSGAIAMSVIGCGSSSSSSNSSSSAAASTEATSTAEETTEASSETSAESTEASTESTDTSADASTSDEEVLTSTEGPSYTFRCSTNHSETFCTSVALKKWADLVNERTNGRIQIDIYYDAVIADEKSAIEQCQYGGLDFARVSISPLAEFDDSFNALQMPFIFKDDQHFWDVMGGDIGMGILQSDSMVDAGLYGLTYYDAGTRNFYNSKKEIHTPDDMKGMTIRVQESDLMMGMIEALGASPQAMAYGDVYSALQTGVVDGAENSITQYLEVAHYEVAPYLTLDNHVRAADTLIMSEKVREELSDEDMAVIEQCALESWDYQKELWAESEDEALEELKSSGVTITELTEDEQKQFEDACADFKASYQDGKYADILSEIEALAQ